MQSLAGPLSSLVTPYTPIVTVWMVRALMGLPGLIIGLLLFHIWRNERAERAALCWAGAGFAQFVMMIALAMLGQTPYAITLTITSAFTILTVALLAGGARLLANSQARITGFLAAAAVGVVLTTLLIVNGRAPPALLLTFAVGIIGCLSAMLDCRRIGRHARSLQIALGVRAVLFGINPVVIFVAPTAAPWAFIVGCVVFALALTAALILVQRRRQDAQNASRVALSDAEALLRAANDISVLAASGLTLPELAQGIVDKLHQALGPQVVMLHDYDPAAREFAMLAMSRDMPTLRAYTMRVPEDRNVNVSHLAAGETVVVTDFANNPHVSEIARQMGESLAVKQQVFIPIMVGGRLRGALTILFGRIGELPEAWIQAAHVVARAAGLSLQLRQQLEALGHQATHDSLTGLCNRAALHEHFDAFIQRQPLARPALMLVDLNRFKEINDALGHQMGDRLICALAQRLQGFAAVNAAVCARLGGDEFTLALLADIDAARAAALCEEVHTLVLEPFEIDALHLSVSSSIGVSLRENTELDSHELLRRADVAMYHSKTNDLSFTIYGPELDPGVRERLQLLSAVHTALATNQFHLFYQPKVRLRDGVVIGVEALLRWQHPELGWIAPGRFIPIVELGPLINQVSLWVANTAVAQSVLWRAQGIDLSIAMNISPRNLLSPSWCAAFLDLVRQANLPRGYLELEITETSLMSNAEFARTQLEEFTAAGVSVSIDDFGTGYSSLSYLQKLAIDTVKIDRAFVMHLAEKPQDAKLAASIILLAKSLGLQVVAEGIEDVQTHAILCEMDCDIGQGFFYAKPLPVAEFENWLRGRSGLDAVAS